MLLFNTFPTCRLITAFEEIHRLEKYTNYKKTHKKSEIWVITKTQPFVTPRRTIKVEKLEK